MLNNEKEIHSEKSSRNHYEDNMVLALQDYYNQKKYLLRPWVMFNTLGKIIGASETKIRKNVEKKKEWIYQHETMEKN